MAFRIKSDNFVLRNWKGARVAEEARLESVYSPKGNRGFESPSFRFYIYNKVYEEKYSYCTFCNIGFHMDVFSAYDGSRREHGISSSS